MLNTLIVNEFEGRAQYRRKPKFWELDRKGKLIESKAKQNQFDGKVIAERERTDSSLIGGAETTTLREVKSYVIAMIAKI